MARCVPSLCAPVTFLVRPAVFVIPHEKDVMDCMHKKRYLGMLSLLVLTDGDNLGSARGDYNVINLGRQAPLQKAMAGGLFCHDRISWCASFRRRNRSTGRDIKSHRDLLTRRRRWMDGRGRHGNGEPITTTRAGLLDFVLQQIPCRCAVAACLL